MSDAHERSAFQREWTAITAGAKARLRELVTRAESDSELASLVDTAESLYTLDCEIHAFPCDLDTDNDSDDSDDDDDENDLLPLPRGSDAAGA